MDSFYVNNKWLQAYEGKSVFFPGLSVICKGATSARKQIGLLNWSLATFAQIKKRMRESLRRPTCSDDNFFSTPKVDSFCTNTKPPI